MMFLSYLCSIQLSNCILLIRVKSFVLSVIIIKLFTTAVHLINKSKLLCIGAPLSCKRTFSFTNKSIAESMGRMSMLSKKLSKY